MYLQDKTLQSIFLLKKGLDLWEKYFMLLQQHAISNIFKITYAVIIQRDFYSKNLDSG